MYAAIVTDDRNIVIECKGILSHIGAVWPLVVFQSSGLIHKYAAISAYHRLIVQPIANRADCIHNLSLCPSLINDAILEQGPPFQCMHVSHLTGSSAVSQVVNAATLEQYFPQTAAA
jgi:hypothetical protein